MIQSEKHKGYLNTIGFHEALWGIPCTNQRPNVGNTYYVLTLLDNEEATDTANTQIIDCIAEFTNHHQSGGIEFIKRSKEK
ncbi:hypothetical protein [Neisseria iguanae]|uniref:Uncharacterized protein n=1 Tax=Neisseria iguanae TaxID=90242 RepID=A0A2P7TYF7_9NEIS|nr:hypothetical protein [Neisseria iguanae]PSJ79764.1 hypothetical protein C7N83_10210 [Neisseria iguanae]